MATYAAENVPSNTVMNGQGYIWNSTVLNMFVDHVQEFLQLHQTLHACKLFGGVIEMVCETSVAAPSHRRKTLTNVTMPNRDIK